MKPKINLAGTKNLEGLANTILQTNAYFLDKAHKQVNTALTLRNWLIGHYITEYEQSGKDRADYGQGLFKAIAERLTRKGIKSIRERHLYLCKDFYKAYPQILRTLSAKSYLANFEYSEILRTVTAESSGLREIQSNINELVANLSFSHFIELLKNDSESKRRFYEQHAIKNNWSVRDLKRAMDSMLFERTGLSLSKETPIEKFNTENKVKPEDIFRNTYLLEFLGLEEKLNYSESDLEESIITHLQNF